MDHTLMAHGPTFKTDRPKSRRKKSLRLSTRERRRIEGLDIEAELNRTFRKK